MERDKPGVGATLIGMFSILFGSCLLLAGGGCTILLILVAGSAGDVGPVVLPLLVAAFGGFCIWLGRRVMEGPVHYGEALPEPEPETEAKEGAGDGPG